MASDSDGGARWGRRLRAALPGWVAPALVTVLAPLLLVELGFRVYFAFEVGPSVLFYGTGLNRKDVHADDPDWRERQTVRFHENRTGGYSKYFPHQTRRDIDPRSGETFEVGINNQGFRGPDFELAKPAGVLRVVTLGASSTFGYRGRDGDTYPVQLQRMLDERCPAQRFEVINLGIPSLRSDQIAALFRAEGLPLDPDLVTFYEGYNDAAAWISRPHPVRKFFAKHFLGASYLDRVVKERNAGFDRAAVEAPMERKSAHLLGSLRRIRDAAREHGSDFIVVSQQVKSKVLDEEEIRGVSYAEEERLVEEALARRRVDFEERVFLIHARLMDAARRWARAEGIPYVDGIAALDGDRDTLVTHVHLDRRGNRLLAAAIAEEILRRHCGPAATPARRP